METWLREKSWRELGYSLALGGLALLAGLGAVALVMAAICFGVFLFAAFVTRGKYQSMGLPLTFTGLVTAWLFIDSIRSRRDDFSIIPLWLLRESAGLGPRLLIESYRQARRAIGFFQLDVPTCSAVLVWLAAKRHAVSREDLLRAFPDVIWARLSEQLHLIEGVIFLRSDYSRLTLSQPLRLLARQWQTHQPKPAAAPPESAEPVPVTEPDKLSAHEILGVSPSATLAEIKLAYRTRVKECHPDRFVGMDAASLQLAEEWTKALNAAYARLVAKRTAPRS